MLLRNLFKTNIKFKSSTRNEILEAKTSNLASYLNLYIDETLVFSFVEGVDTISHLRYSTKTKSNNYRKTLESEIYIWCQRNGYSCQTDLNCNGYESLGDYYYCEKDGNTLTISVVMGAHSCSRDKARLFSEIADLKSVKGVFEKGQFVY